MTTTSYPAAGTGGLSISEWGNYFEGSDGIIDDYAGTSLDLTRINTGEIARIAPGKVRVGGYVLEVTSNDDLVVSTAAATYYIWACYDPALNVPDGGGNATAAGPCTLGISSGAPSTAGGKVYQLLYQIIRSASQALTATTVVDYRVWTGPTLHIPAASTVPSGILTDPITAITGFSYPVGTRLVYGSGVEYTVVKSTSGLKFERGAGLIPDQQRFTSSGTWTKPANAKYVFAEVQAGGGGGGGSQVTGSGESSAGSGGEGGGYAASILDASTLAATVAVTVGAGGSASAGGAGGTGGTSSFGAHVSATGGDGGSAAAGSPSPVATSGGNSTQTLVGQTQIPGGGGGALARLGTGQGGIGGTGGNAYLGNGGGGRGGDNAGLPGKNYGGGGGGAAATQSQSSKSGGAGAPGLVRITTYS